MKLNWRHLVHDVVVAGGVVESMGSIIGTLGISLPARDVVIVSAATAGAGALVSVGEDLLNNANPTSSLGQLLKWVVGLLSHTAQPAPAPAPAVPTPAVSGPQPDPAVDPPAHPDPPVGG